jgi:hypothetical protein
VDEKEKDGEGGKWDGGWWLLIALGATWRGKEGAQGGPGVGSMPRGGRRRSGEGGCGATRAGMERARWLWATRTATGGARRASALRTGEAAGASDAGAAGDKWGWATSSPLANDGV